MPTVAVLVAKLEADVRDFERGIKSAEDRLDKLERSTKKADQSSGGLFSTLSAGKVKAVAAGAAIAGVGIVAFDLVSSFSDLEESINAVEVQFGAGADTIKTFGETAATSVGISNSAFNQLSVVTGATLAAFIEDEQAAAEETLILTQRAADMASVFNTDVDEALVAFQSALRGESEPIRRFGVNLDDATVKLKAVELGLADTTAEVTLQDKGLARLELIYDQTNKTAGDFANTSDSLANRMRVLGARFEDAKAEIGEGLVPAFQDLLTALEDSIPLLIKAGEVFAGFITIIVGSNFTRFHDDVDTMNKLLAEGFSPADALREVHGDLGAALTASGLEMQALFKAQEAEVIAAEAATLAADAEGDAFKESAFQGAAFAKAQNAIEKALIPTTEELIAQKDAILRLAQETAAAADPAINLIRRNEDAAAAEANLTALRESGAASVAEITEATLRAIEANNDLDVAQAEVALSLAATIEAFREDALAAGATRAEIDLLVASLFGIPSDIGVNIALNVSGDIGDLDRIIAAGGGGFIGGTIKGFADGGTVPGPIGAPQLAVVHGGETITPARQAAAGGTVVNLFVEGSVVTEQDLVVAVRDGLIDLERTNGTSGL